MSTSSVTLNGNKLKEIANRNLTASATAEALRTRERIRHFSDISRTRSQLAREGAMIVDTDYMQFWKDLEAAGVGSIIYGRKGKPDRFSWHYSLKSVAKAMLDGADLKVPKGAKVSAKQTEEPQEESDLETLTKQVTFVLSPTRVVELRMPDSFTKDEAEGVCAALRKMANA